MTVCEEMFSKGEPHAAFPVQESMWKALGLCAPVAKCIRVAVDAGLMVKKCKDLLKYANREKNT